MHSIPHPSRDPCGAGGKAPPRITGRETRLGRLSRLARRALDGSGLGIARRRASRQQLLRENEERERAEGHHADNHDDLHPGGAYVPVSAHMLEPPCWAAAVPSETPGAPATLNPTKEVSSSHTRLKNTPATTHTLAAATKPIRARFFANTRMQNGMRMPTTISNQKNGAVAPVAMMASVWRACGRPGTP